MNPDPLLAFRSLSNVARVRHGFACADLFGGFDAARAPDRERLLARVLPGGAWIPTRQTHTSNVRAVTVADAGAWRGVTDVDGLVTDSPGLLLQAISADCPLLLLAAVDDAGGARAVGAVHCGWRGIARGIVDAALSTLDESFAVMPRSIVAAITPGAGGCCYEVGDEVLDGLASAGVDVDACVRPCARGSGKSGRSVDLKAAIRGLLEQSGVPRENVEVSPECTICGGARFHSYRRDGNAALRSAGVIGMTAAPA